MAAAAAADVKNVQELEAENEDKDVGQHPSADAATGKKKINKIRISKDSNSKDIFCNSRACSFGGNRSFSIFA